MARVFIALTSGTTFTIPIDCNSLTVECVGAGANPSSGGVGGGGAYSKTNTLAVTPLAKAFCAVGVNGGDSWFNIVSNVAPSFTTDGALAKGGSAVGGSAASGVGDVKFSGGAGGNNSLTGVFGGGGGAAGPNGNGGAGASYTLSTTTGAGGGGANGGGNGSGTAGGTGPTGTAGGANSTVGNATAGTNGSGGGGSTILDAFGGNGSQYVVWTDFKGVTYGLGSGGGGSNTSGSSQNGYSPGYGGCGNDTNSGLIIVSYVPVAIPAGTYTEVITSSSTNTINWRAPAGVSSVTASVIGSGGLGGAASFGSNYFGGGGGAFATASASVVENQVLYARVGISNSNPSTLANTLVSVNSNLSSPFVNASGGGRGDVLSGGIGGTVLVGTGFAGGNGGLNSSQTSQQAARGGGGGGAGGTTGAGRNGGNAQAVTTSSGRAGGGGGAGFVGANVSSTVGSPGGTTTGGAGGAGPSGTSGGAGATTGALAGAGANGSGGGGGSATTAYVTGGAGSMFPVPAWAFQGSSFGPGSGGGGGGQSTATVGMGGVGGAFGGGGGGGGSNANTNALGANGLVVLTYTVAANNPSSSSMLIMF